VQSVVALALAHAAPGPSSVLAPSTQLESFLESGSHSAAEIDAMANAEIDAVLGSENTAASESTTESSEQQTAVPPAPTGSTAASIPIAIQGSDRDDIVRLVYDELKRLSNAASTQLPGAPGSPTAVSVTDPRVRNLERRLSMFESKRTTSANRLQDAAISKLTSRLEGLAKQLDSLKVSAQQQAAVSQQMVQAKRESEEKFVSSQDWTVSYEPASLPADFDKKVTDILMNVKREARNIYQKYCRGCRRNGPPKSYPKEATPAPTGLSKPKIPKNPFKKEPKMNTATPKKVSVTPTGAHANQEQPQQTAAHHDQAAASSEAAPDASAPAAEQTEHHAAPKHVRRHAAQKAKKLMFPPVIVGKEPTPEGLRLNKALNDIAKALPVKPAYHLGKEEAALSEVLGPNAVSNKWKSPRFLEDLPAFPADV